MEKTISSVTWNRKTFHWSIRNFSDISGLHEENKGLPPPGGTGGIDGQEFDCLLDIDFLQSPVIEVGSVEDGYRSQWLAKLTKSSTHENAIDFQLELLPEEPETEEPLLECFFKYSVEVLGTNGKAFTTFGKDSQKIIFLKCGHSWCEPGFLKIDDLSEKYAQVVHDDTLNLKLVISVLKDLQHTRVDAFPTNLKLSGQPTKRRKYSYPDWNEILKSYQYTQSKDILNHLWNSKQNSDVSISCANSVFNVHKIILSSASPVFAAALSHEMSESFENRITVNDTSPPIVETLLRFIYCDINLDENVWENIDDLTEVLNVAEKYQVSSLKSLCFSRVCHALSLSNAGHIAVLVHLFEPETSVKNFVHRYILKNLSTLRETDSFKKKMLEVPAAFTPLLLMTDNCS